MDRWSFGSGVLAYLYRELCKSVDPERKNMGGCVLLLQLWAWFLNNIKREVLKLLNNLDKTNIFNITTVRCIGLHLFACTLVLCDLAIYKRCNSLNASLCTWCPYCYGRTSCLLPRFIRPLSFFLTSLSPGNNVKLQTSPRFLHCDLSFTG